MAIKTSNSNTTTAVGNAEETEVVSLAKVEETRQTYDLSAAREAYKQEILASGEVDRLTSQIDISNTTSIIEFGKEPAQKMAQLSDQVLSKYNSATIDDTSKLVGTLLDIMKKIDIGEIKSLEDLKADAKKGILAKFKQSAKDKLDKLVSKYKSIGTEMEQICSQLAVYEQQIKDSNKDIAKMYDAAREEYRSLVATIMAAEQAIVEIEQYRNEKQAEYEQTGNPDIQFEVQNISQALTLMEQRTADLRGAEAVALQSIPTFKIQEVTNANLARKVNSAFIVTVPAFKTALVNSVIAKQQAIQAQGLSALDEATNQLVMMNAQNAVTQLQRSQQLANSSAIKADTIEQSWNTIMTGIEQYKEMEKQYAEIRKDEAKRIEECNNRYFEQMHNGNVL